MKLLAIFFAFGACMCALTIGLLLGGRGNSTTPTKIRAGEPLTYGVFQPLGVTLPVNDCATILPSRTTKVSVPISYTLSTVSALHRM
jgi:hypothetical protein